MVAYSLFLVLPVRVIHTLLVRSDPSGERIRQKWLCYMGSELAELLSVLLGSSFSCWCFAEFVVKESSNAGRSEQSWILMTNLGYWFPVPVGRGLGLDSFPAGQPSIPCSESQVWIEVRMGIPLQWEQTQLISRSSSLHHQEA